MRYELICHQAEFIRSNALHTALVGGYGCGKTFIGILKTVSKKLELPGIDVAYYLPTYELIKDIAFPNFSNILRNQNVPFKLHETDKVFTTPYGRIILRSMDKPTSIIGYETGYALIDEADVVDRKKMKEAFKNIIARNRKKLPSNAVNATDFVSTPEGYGFLYDFFVKNQNDNRRLIKGRTIDNPNNSDHYIQNLRESYTESQLKAYLNGDFVNLDSSTVFYQFDRNINFNNRQIAPTDHLHIGMDFNIENMSAVVHVIDGEQIKAVAELTNVFDTPAMARKIKEMYPNNKITIYPDASGNNRKTVGMSDIQHLRSEKFTVVTGKSNPKVKDRITSTNVAFRDGNGKSRYSVNIINCPEYTEALEKLAYKNGEPDKTSGFDHVTDAGSYALFKLINFNQKFDGINL